MRGSGSSRAPGNCSGNAGTWARAKAIQERSGAGQGSVYHHLSGKQDLALAAIRRNAADLTSRMDAEPGGAGKHHRTAHQVHAPRAGGPARLSGRTAHHGPGRDVRPGAAPTGRGRLRRGTPPPRRGSCRRPRRTGSLTRPSTPWPPRPRWWRCCRADMCSLARPTRRIPTRRPSRACSRCSPAAPGTERPHDGCPQNEAADSAGVRRSGPAGSVPGGVRAGPATELGAGDVFFLPAGV